MIGNKSCTIPNTVDGIVGSEIADQLAKEGRKKYQSSSHLSYKETRTLIRKEARCSSVVRAFAHGTMGRRIDPS